MAKLKKNEAYFLLEDILYCFPTRVEHNLISVLNRHKLAKDNVRFILKEEITLDKPRYRILAGALILLNNFLRTLPQVAYYEVIEVLEELKFCFYKDGRKFIKKISAQTILRLFATLYYEIILLPSKYKRNSSYINSFKKTFSRQDIINIINFIADKDGILLHFIFSNHGLELGTDWETRRKNINGIISKFY